MKNLFPLLIGVLFLMTGCESLGLVKIKMDTDKAVNRVVENYEKYIDTDQYKPVSIMWYAMDKLSNQLTHMSVDMVGQDGKVYNLNIKVGGDYQGPSDIKESRLHKEEFDFSTVKWIKASDINSGIILKQFEASKTQFEDELTFKSLNDYRMSVDPLTGETEYRLAVDFIEKGNSTKIKGGSLVTEYYRLDFVGHGDGSVEYVE